mgnify:CR=1 FL=1
MGTLNLTWLVILDVGKFNGGYICIFAHRPISWCSSLQLVIALFTEKAEILLKTPFGLHSLWTDALKALNKSAYALVEGI